MKTYAIKRCSNCSHCFKSKRSKTGYSCEVWGHDDFACDTILEGYCHKFKALPELDSPDGVYMFKTEDKAKEILDAMNRIWDEYWIVFKNGEYVSGTDEFGYPTHTKDRKEAFKFYDFNTAISYFNLGYSVIKE